MAVALVLQASASNAAFYAIFGIFVAAMLVLIVIILVWAIRHDVAGRAAWRERQQAADEGVEQPTPPQPRRSRPGRPPDAGAHR